MKLTATAMLILAIAAPVGRSATISQRVTELEARVAKLEAALKSAQSTDGAPQGAVKVDRDRLKTLSRARMRKDQDTYSRQELQEIESLYQVANKKWRTDEGKDSLKRLISKYKKANRTGCALLYLGQMSKGDEQLAYLQQAIDEFSDCFYGNGVQVGAYARLKLAGRYHADGETEKAEALMQEIRADYPGAIDHRGNALETILKEYFDKKK